MCVRRGGEARVHLAGDRAGHGAVAAVLGPETDFGVELVSVFQVEQYVLGREINVLGAIRAVALDAESGRGVITAAIERVPERRRVAWERAVAIRGTVNDDAFVSRHRGAPKRTATRCSPAWFTAAVEAESDPALKRHEA